MKETREEMETKVLSIIVPTYKAEQFLDKGLSSFILDDGLMDKLEVIVVDDGTPDNSVEVAKKYISRYPGTFRVLSKKNGGHGSAINAGIQVAEGKYFQVVDADDWVDTDVLSDTVEMLEKNDADAFIHAHRTYDISTDQIEHKHVRCPDGSKQYNLEQMMSFWDDIYWGLTFHGVLYNTEFYRQLGYSLIEGVYYEDQEYSTIPLAFAQKIRIYDGELYVYRIGDINQSVSTKSLIKRLPDLEQVIIRLAQGCSLKEKFAAGGERYWLKKLTKCVTDYYHVALIINPDKRAGRERVKELNRKLRGEYPWLYDMCHAKYMIFDVCSHLHMSEHMYTVTIGSLTELRSRMKRANKLPLECV